MPHRTERLGFRISVAIIALITLTALGTLGYVLVENARWFDALYMTVITLSTVGFAEIIPLSTAGRVFTLFLILCGVATAAYFAASLMQLLAADVLLKLIGGKSMQKQIDRMSGHIIVCGYGRFGQIVVEELARSPARIVIIEHNPSRQLELEQRGFPFIVGNATSDEILERAGVMRASTVVAATNSDPDNVFITLAARERRRDLRVTRAARRPRRCVDSSKLAPTTCCRPIKWAG